MYCIVVYDISDLKKQRDIRNFLRRYLKKIQLSVFHGDLNPSQLKEIEIFFERIKFEKNESVVIFYSQIHSRMAYKKFGREIERSNIIS